MRCFGCGAENAPDNIFCQECGRRLRPDAPPAEPQNNAEPEERSEPVETAESVETAELIEPEETAETAESIEPEEPTKPITSTDAAEPNESAEDAEPTDTSGGQEDERRNMDAREYTGHVEMYDDGSYRINYKNPGVCPVCGAELTPGASFCTNCAYQLNKNPKKKKSAKFKIIIIATAAVVLAALVGICVMLYPKAYNLEGMWMSESGGDTVFGMSSGSYMVFDDDCMEYYYNAFYCSEYEYSYNAFTRTLKLYGNGNKTQILHLVWLGKDTFIIVENGDTFSRISEANEEDNSGGRQYSI